MKRKRTLFERRPLRIPVEALPRPQRRPSEALVIGCSLLVGLAAFIYFAATAGR